MKRLIPALVVGCLAVTAMAVFRTPSTEAARGTAPAASSARGSADADVGGKLVVHEWGTFTTFSGSNGVRMEFRPLIDNDLPDFVLDRGEQSGTMHPFAKGRVRASVRMETPVAYFYTDRERDVRVRVDFPQGLLTEFYPPVAKMEPPFDWMKSMAGEKITRSSLDWGTVHLIPTSHLKTHVQNAEVAKSIDRRLMNALVPPTPNEDHYGYARETDSALVSVNLPVDPKLPMKPSGAHFEKFLFYRGVGKFDLPLKLESNGGGKYQLTNSGKDPIRSLFLVNVRGPQIRYAAWDSIAAGETRTLHESTSDATIESLGAAVEESLVREGLYAKEARAMVKTWQSSWFGEEGTRLFYVVPRPLTDSLLPLSVEPAPEETVRVLVGRMEILSTEDESRMLAILRQSIVDRAKVLEEQRKAEVEVKPSEDGTVPEPPKPVAPYQLPESLRKMGRLAEPALVRLQHIAKEDALRAEAIMLLRELHAELQKAEATNANGASGT